MRSEFLVQWKRMLTMLDCLPGCPTGSPNFCALSTRTWVSTTKVVCMPMVTVLTSNIHTFCSSSKPFDQATVKVAAIFHNTTSRLPGSHLQLYLRVTTNVPARQMSCLRMLWSHGPSKRFVIAPSASLFINSLTSGDSP